MASWTDLAPEDRKAAAKALRRAAAALEKGDQAETEAALADAAEHFGWQGWKWD